LAAREQRAPAVPLSHPQGACGCALNRRRGSVAAGAAALYAYLIGPLLKAELTGPRGTHAEFAGKRGRYAELLRQGEMQELAAAG